MVKITIKNRKKIAAGWNMKVKDVDWKFVESIKKKSVRRKK